MFLQNDWAQFVKDGWLVSKGLCKKIVLISVYSCNSYSHSFKDFSVCPIGVLFYMFLLLILHPHCVFGATLYAFHDLFSMPIRLSGNVCV